MNVPLAPDILERVDAASIVPFRRLLSAWGRENRRSFPWRGERDAFRVLVAEILLQRSRGTTVAKVYERLFDRWPDAAHLARAREASVASVIRPLGLVRRAKALKALAKEIDRRREVPDSLEQLAELPGVGPYAASATLAVAFGRRVPTVDGVTARVYRRYFAFPADRPASTDRELWALVQEVTPHRNIREWNWAVLDLAATICLPGRPKCPECPLRAHCAWSRAAGNMVGAAC